MNPTDQEIIDGIRKNDGAIIGHLNTDYFPKIKNHVLHNSGNTEDAKDVYQESLCIFCEKIKSGSLKLNSRLNTYFYAICKYQWLVRLKKMKKIVVYDDEIYIPNEGSSSVEFEKQSLKKYKLYRKHFNRLDKRCKEILGGFVDGGYDVVKAKMNTTSIAYARKVKHECWKKLLGAIHKDPSFEKLIMKGLEDE